MAFITDTHNVIDFLQKKGYSKEQAEGFIEVVKEFETSELVTKADLKSGVSDLKVELLKMMTVQGVAIIGLTVALIQLLN